MMKLKMKFLKICQVNDYGIDYHDYGDDYDDCDDD